MWLSGGPLARADGPHIALHAIRGTCEITLFSAPDPLVTGPIDLTLLVEDAQTGALLSPATVRGQLRLSVSNRTGSEAAVLPLTLTRAGSSNRQLLGETVLVKAPGLYALRLRVEVPGRPAEVFEGTLPVGRNRGKRDTVLWAVFLAIAVIGLFLVNQSAKWRLRAVRIRAG